MYLLKGNHAHPREFYMANSYPFTILIRSSFVLILVYTCLGMSSGLTQTKRLLLYTETGGFDHKTRTAAESMFSQLGNTHQFTVLHDEDGSTFNSLDSLKTYSIVVFCNTSGDNILSTTQQQNFQAYMNDGGAYLGIHAASDTYRHSSANGPNTGTWDWYAEMMGGSVQNSPNHTVNNFSGTMDHEGTHPSIMGLPNPWEKDEEYYYWENGYLKVDIQSVLTVRSTGGDSYDAARPMSWYLTSTPDGNPARIFYTALGHNASNFTNDTDFIKHIEQATVWAGSFGSTLTNTPPSFTLDGEATRQEDFTTPFKINVVPDPVPSGEEGQQPTYSLSPTSLNFIEVDLNSQTGELTFTAIADANGVDSLTLTANDGQSENNEFSLTFTVRVNAVNDPPSFTLSEDELILPQNFSPQRNILIQADPPPADEQGQSITYKLDPATVPFANVSLNGAESRIEIDAVADSTGTQVFTLRANDGLDSTTQQFTLTVEKAAASLVVSPESISVPAAGGSQAATVESNGSWTASATHNWVSISESEGTGNQEVTISVDANTGASRTAWVVFEQENIRDSISLSQGAVGATPSVSISSPTDSAQVDPSFFLIFIIENWVVGQGQSHFHYFIDGVDQGPVFSRNPLFIQDLSLGFHTIRLQLAEADHSFIDVEDSILVEVVPATILSVIPENVIFLQEGGKDTIDITSNVDWTIRNTLPWLSLSDTVGSGNGMIILTAEENTESNLRKGNIILEGRNKNVFIEVSQEGTISAPCTPPDSLWVSDIQETSALLRWSAIPDADEYQVLYKPEGDMDWTEAFNLSTDSLLLENLNENTTYQWQIRTRCFATYSAWSLITTFSTASPIMCEPPANIQVVERLSNLIRLDWDDMASASEYEVERRESGTTTWLSETFNTSEATLGNLEAETLYEWRIRTVCMSDTSAWTATDTASTAPSVETCDVPTNLSIIEVFPDVARVSWDVVSNVSVYRIRLRAGMGTPWSPANTASGNTWLFNNLMPDQQYEWQVEAICGATNSGYSTIASFRTPADSVPTDSMTTPVFRVNLTNFTVVQENGQVLLRWESDLEEGGREYVVERGIDGTLFEEIGTRSFQNMGAAYNFQDTSPPLGEVFYRIKMVGIDGSVSYSETESIVLEVNSVTLQTYPNPVRDILTVNLQSEGQQKVYLVLFDHLGRRIWYRYLDLQTGTQTIELDMTTYQTQLYYLSMIELGLSISDNSIKNVRVQKID